MTDSVQTEQQPEQCPETMLVRYGLGGQVGQFRNLPGQTPRCGSKVIVQTDRGMEVGEVISLSCANCGRAVRQEHLEKYVNCSGPENCNFNAGKLLRMATKADLDEAEHIARNANEMRRYCQEKARAMGLDMRVVAVEHVFGGERAIFYFQSENRIDFRSLVRELAHEYQTRIEMRQIGARDEARLLADYEICGRECCCRNFLKNLKPVNMKMAKTQKATLDPTKVSGRCGRLRCCLRFESETYESLDRNLPNQNSRVRVEQGVGRVLDRHILTQMLILAMEPDGTRVAVPVEAVLERNVKTPPVTRPEPGPDSRRRPPRPMRPSRPLSGEAVARPSAPVVNDPAAPSSDVPADASAQAGQTPATGDPARRSKRRRRRKPRGDNAAGGDRVANGEARPIDASAGEGDGTSDPSAVDAQAGEQGGQIGEQGDRPRSKRRRRRRGRGRGEGGGNPSPGGDSDGGGGEPSGGGPAGDSQGGAAGE